MGFPFELVADPAEALCARFDVIRMKKMYGKDVRGIERSTFVLGPGWRNREGVARGTGAGACGRGARVRAIAARLTDEAMADMLVRLYALPDVGLALDEAARHGVAVRRPEPWERDLTVGWVRATFSDGWAAECDLAFTTRPASCFVAIRHQSLVGFACHDCTRRNFFGPAGVDPATRGLGCGAALTLAALASMRDAGYAYAIIGGVGPAQFYAKVAGATPIDGSTPGIYDFGLVQREH